MPKRLVQQRALTLEAERVLGVGQPEEPAPRDEQVVVELPGESQ